MPKKFNGLAAEILLVEDNPGDARLTQEALNDGRLNNVLHHVRDGVEALEFLRREGKFAEAPRPDLILLDLNMPRMDGRELLSVLKADNSLCAIPVVVLTTSDAEVDVAASYRDQAACFITKPVDFEQFQHIVQAVKNFWFQIVCLPETSDSSA